MKLNFAISIFSLFFLMSCQSDSTQSSCPEGESFDSVKRRCVGINLGSSIKITNAIPSESYNINIDDTFSKPHLITIDSPDSVKYIIEWSLINGDQKNILLSGTSFAYSLNPSTLPATGNYILEASVKSTDSELVYASYQWTILATDNASLQFNSTIPAIQNLELNANGAITAFQVAYNNSSNLTDISLVWKLDGAIIQTDENTEISSSASYSLNPTGISMGSHLLEAQAKVGNATLATHSWIVSIVQPTLAQITTINHPLTESFTAINNNFLNQANIFEHNDLSTDLCINIDAIDRSNISVQFFANETPLTNKVAFPAADACLQSILQINPINLDDPQTSQSFNLTAKVFQSIADIGVHDFPDEYEADSRAWNTTIYPKNSAPTANIVGNNVIGLQQETVQNIQIQIQDINGIPTQSDQYEVYFVLNGVSLDGITHIPDTPVVSNDCQHNKTIDSNFLNCDLIIPSYGNNGPLPLQSYTLEAYVVDTANLSFNGVDLINHPNNNLQSNRVTWNILTLEAQSPPVISSTNIYQASNIGTPIANANESDQIVFEIAIDDPNRDHFFYQLCKTSDCSDANDPLTTGAINRTSSINPYIQQINYNIPQSEVVGMASSNINYFIRVTDLPESLSGTQVTANPVLNIINHNPAPIIATNTQIPLTSTSLKVMPSFPISFDIGSVSDPSITDGQNIEYQWQVALCSSLIDCSSITFSDIDGATQSTLNWTPPTTSIAQRFQIRSCVGDDGFGNEVANCSIFQIWQDVQSIPNSFSSSLTPSTSNLETATWYDSVLGSLYMAYIGQTNSNIIIARHKLDGSNQVDQVILNAEQTELTNGINSLRLIGNSANKSLYLSYISEVQVDPSPTYQPRLRIRRLDIEDNSLFGFSYDEVLIMGNCFSINRINDETRVTISTPTSLCQTGDSVEVNGVQFELVVQGETSPQLNTTQITFDPTSLDSNQLATLIANSINSTTDTRIGSISVGISSSIMLFNTLSISDEFYDSQTPVRDIGSMIYSASNTELIVPYIDRNDDTAKILKKGVAGALMSSGNPSILDTQITLVQKIASSSNANNLNFSTQRFSGEIDLYQCDYSTSACNNALTPFLSDVFSGESGIIDLKMSQGATPFIAIKNISEIKISNQSSIIDLAFNLDDFQLFSHLNYGGVIGIDTSNQLRFWKIKSDFTLEQSNAIGLSSITSNSKLSISSIHPDLSFGDSGSVSNENQKDSIFISLYSTNPHNLIFSIEETVLTPSSTNNSLYFTQPIINTN